MLPNWLRNRLLIWQRFTSRQNLQPDVDPMIVQSWQRCLPRLNPHEKVQLKKLSPENLLSTQSANFDFISIAQPIMEDIYQFIEDSDSTVLLVNSAGYILEWLGDASMIALAERHQLQPAALISEEQIGTNAFALAILDRMPAAVVGPEHFLRQFHKLAASAAPVFNPAGRPLGALGVLTKAQNFHPHALGLVVAGARAIEGQLQSDLLLHEQIEQLAELNAILTSIEEGIMVWNNEGILLHANAAANRILGSPSSPFVGRRVEDYIGFPNVLQQALTEGRPVVNVEANLTVDGRAVNCVASLHFVARPSGTQWVILTLSEAEQVRQLVHHQVGPQVTVSVDDFLGQSKAIQRMRYLAKTAAPARACILLHGENGTGKNYLARALHYASPRRTGPFLIFSCASVPNELAIVELMGFEEGLSNAHPGGRPSKFELAHNGTLFFQDIEALPLEVQAQLLNVLELGIIQRLGSSRPTDIDVRVIASSSADLESLVAEGGFRADLFYRLSVFEIEVPSLRDRPADLPQLVERILGRLSEQYDRSLELAPGVLEILKQYHWPGNIPELEAILERATVQASPSGTIDETHLPGFLRHPANLPTQRDRLTRVPSMDALQRDAILQAARICNGNVSQMAKVLGIGRTTVWRKMKEFDISADSFRRSAQKAANLPR